MKLTSNWGNSNITKQVMDNCVFGIGNSADNFVGIRRPRGFDEL